MYSLRLPPQQSNTWTLCVIGQISPLGVSFDAHATWMACDGILNDGFHPVCDTVTAAPNSGGTPYKSLKDNPAATKA
jgi:hypothetical protein